MGDSFGAEFSFLKWVNSRENVPLKQGNSKPSSWLRASAKLEDRPLATSGSSSTPIFGMLVLVDDFGILVANMEEMR